MQTSFVAVLALAALISGCAAESIKKSSVQKPIVRAGTLQTKDRQETPFKLEIALTQLSDIQLRDQVTTRIFGGGGRGDTPTSRVLERMRLIIGGKTFDVPPKGLADLTQPNLPETLAVSSNKGEIVVSFEGSEGEFFYQCRFYASENGFIKRIVSEPLNPKYQNVVLKF